MRNFVRLVSAVLISIGAGLLVYGTSVEQANYRAPAGIRLIATPSECAAWSTGMLVGGVLFLLLFGMRAPNFDKPGKP